MSAPLTDRAVQSRAKPDSRRSDIPGSDWCTGAELFVIAVLLMLYGILRFPELGAVIAQYNQF